MTKITKMSYRLSTTLPLRGEGREGKRRGHGEGRERGKGKRREATGRERQEGKGQRKRRGRKGRGREMERNDGQLTGMKNSDFRPGPD